MIHHYRNPLAVETKVFRRIKHEKLIETILLIMLAIQSIIKRIYILTVTSLDDTLLWHSSPHSTILQ